MFSTQPHNLCDQETQQRLEQLHTKVEAGEKLQHEDISLALLSFARLNSEVGEEVLLNLLRRGGEHNPIAEVMRTLVSLHKEGVRFNGKERERIATLPLITNYETVLSIIPELADLLEIFPEEFTHRMHLLLPSIRSASAADEEGAALKALQARDDWEGYSALASASLLRLLEHTSLDQYVRISLCELFCDVSGPGLRLPSEHLLSFTSSRPTLLRLLEVQDSWDDEKHAYFREVLRVLENYGKVDPVAAMSLLHSLVEDGYLTHSTYFVSPFGIYGSQSRLENLLSRVPHQLEPEEIRHITRVFLSSEKTDKVEIASLLSNYPVEHSCMILQALLVEAPEVAVEAAKALGTMYVSEDLRNPWLADVRNVLLPSVAQIGLLSPERVVREAALGIIEAHLDIEVQLILVGKSLFSYFDRFSTRYREEEHLVALGREARSSSRFSGKLLDELVQIPRSGGGKVLVGMLSPTLDKEPREHLFRCLRSIAADIPALVVPKLTEVLTWPQGVFVENALAILRDLGSAGSSAATNLRSLAHNTRALRAKAALAWASVMPEAEDWHERFTFLAQKGDVTEAQQILDYCVSKPWVPLHLRLSVANYISQRRHWPLAFVKGQGKEIERLREHSCKVLQSSVHEVKMRQRNYESRN